MAPRTRYARVGTAHVAYQCIGEGPVDVVFVPEWTTHLELQWEEPACARFLDRLSSFARVILFDKRGVGLSDPLAAIDGIGLDPWMDDVGAVLDATGCERAAFIGTGAGGPMTMLFAASHPDRTSKLVCVNTAARFVAAPDYPCGLDPNAVEHAAEWTRETWGTGAIFSAGAPSLASSPAARAFHARLQRASMSPGVAAAMQRVLLAIDIRAVLPSIHAPTLVVHRRDDQLVALDHGRYLAAHIPDATLVELPGADHLYYASDDALLDHAQSFLTGAVAPVESERVLATVLFTDIVGSTDHAARLGDRRWRDVLDRHDSILRRQLDRFRGREINTAGDGFFATFDGPARALRCACAIRDEMAAAGLDVRIGVHTGEIETRGDDYSGIGVHIGARVGARAPAGEVLVTRTVVDLVAGSGIEFESTGPVELKGVPGAWELARVVAA